jgi:hypothetical protein
MWLLCLDTMMNLVNLCLTSYLELFIKVNLAIKVKKVKF